MESKQTGEGVDIAVFYDLNYENSDKQNELSWPG